jgi:hypothetical protein
MNPFLREEVAESFDSPEVDEWIKDAAQPTPSVKNPRYRKGTGRRPVSWSDCLWKPGTTYQ